MNDDKMPRSTSKDSGSSPDHSLSHADETQNVAERSRIALKIFFDISDGWNLTGDEKVTLLGNPDPATYSAWQHGEHYEVSEEVIERISYIVGIYRALRTIFPSRDRADAWIKKGNQVYGGRPALAVMLAGNLAEVRRYLDAQCT
jgi:hypothetical protein